VRNWRKGVLASGQELLRDASKDKVICGCYYCPCTANGTTVEEPKKSGTGEVDYKEPGNETPFIATDKDNAPEGGPGADSDAELEPDFKN
jgi:hypothetical protein